MTKSRKKGAEPHTERQEQEVRREADEKKIAGLKDGAALQALWSAVRERRAMDWPPGRAFEYLILRAFELEGATVRYPFDVRWPFGAPGIGERSLEQIDGAIHVDGLHVLVESKDCVAALDIEPLAKLRNQLMRRPAGVVGVCFSTGGFTKAALLLAYMMAPHTILLWSRDELDACFRGAGSGRPFTRALRRKHERAVEEGFVDYNTSLEEQRA